MAVNVSFGRFGPLVGAARVEAFHPDAIVEQVVVEPHSHPRMTDAPLYGLERITAGNGGRLGGFSKYLQGLGRVHESSHSSPDLARKLREGLISLGDAHNIPRNRDLGRLLGEFPPDNTAELRRGPVCVAAVYTLDGRELPKFFGY